MIRAGDERTHQRVVAGAFALSLLLHAALFAAAARLAMPADQPHDIMQIALVGGGGGGSSGAAAASSAPLPAAAEPPAAAPAVAAAVAPSAPIALPAKPRVPDRRAAPPRAAAPQPPAAAPPPPVAALPAANSAGSEGSGTGTGTGNGNGAGSGVGSGSGSGGGAGSGTGAGHGGGNGTGGDLRALCVSCPEPQYPRIARLRGWEGVVAVDISIVADGSVADATVARSSGYAALDDAALEVARKSRFQLAGVAGSPGVRGRIDYGFRLTAR